MTAIDYEAGYPKFAKSTAYRKVGNRIVSLFRAAFRGGVSHLATVRSVRHSRGEMD